MDLKYGFLADCANTSREGKINALGIFEGVYGNTFPVVHPSIAVVAVLAVRPADAGRNKTISVRLLTEDAIQMLKVDLNIAIPPGPLPEIPPIVPIVANLNGIKFENPGRYEFSIEADGHPVGSIPLTVVKMPPVAAR